MDERFRSVEFLDELPENCWSKMVDAEIAIVSWTTAAAELHRRWQSLRESATIPDRKWKSADAGRSMEGEDADADAGDDDCDADDGSWASTVTDSDFENYSS